MKKIILSVLILVTTIFSADRKVLIEAFSATW